MGGRRSEHEVKVCEAYAGGGGALVRHLQRRTGRTPEGAWGDGRGRSPAWTTGGRYHAATNLLQISRCRQSVTEPHCCPAPSAALQAQQDRTRRARLRSGSATRCGLGRERLGTATSRHTMADQSTLATQLRPQKKSITSQIYLPNRCTPRFSCCCCWYLLDLLQKI